MTRNSFENPESLLRASQDAQRRGRFDDMLDLAEQAIALDDRSLPAKFRWFECLLYCGRVDRVLDSLTTIEHEANDDHSLLCKIAEYYTHAANHESALRCYQRAVELDPNNPEYLFALSAAEIAAGKLEAAEQHLCDVIRLKPEDYDAYRNRAMLKKQTKGENHIAEIEAMLAKGSRTPAGEVQLCYALAKEYEDIGEYDRSFDVLRRGADKRRQLLSYRVSGDVDVLQRLRAVYDEELLRRPPAGFEQAGPVFVLGLPRSGTTLVDRILSSHSDVESLGEINNFAYSLMHTVDQSADKMNLIELSSKIDFRELGRRYFDSTQKFGKSGPYLIDKTPLNYLYIGLIRLSLPNARIVHIRRNPMDSCYAMYRTLFRAGFPFSYDFNDLGAYYVAYRHLMDHWHSVAADSFLDIEYESLIDHQEAVSRKIVSYCGLEWQPECLEFHKNSSAILTASSAQVRRPVYRDALHRWRRYETQLQPLIDYLRKNGIDVDAT